MGEENGVVCSAVTDEVLWDIVDSTSTDDRPDVLEHVERCPTCREQFAKVRRGRVFGRRRRGAHTRGGLAGRAQGTYYPRSPYQESSYQELYRGLGDHFLFLEVTA